MEYDGCFSFVSELTNTQIARLSTVLGKNPRHVEGFDLLTDYSGYIDLQLSADFLGVVWDGSDKSHDMDKQINLITQYMRQTMPDFRLQGRMVGYEDGNRFLVEIDGDGIASQKNLIMENRDVVCPNCGHQFTPGGEDVE